MPFYIRSASATLLYKVKNPPVNNIPAFGQDMNTPGFQYDFFLKFLSTTTNSTNFAIVQSTGSQPLLLFGAIAAIETNTNQHFHAIRMRDTFAAF